MMPDEDTRHLAEMFYGLSPDERAKMAAQLGMVDPPPRPRTSREKPVDQPPTRYRVRRVPLG